jgi:hypothetical protein
MLAAEDDEEEGRSCVGLEREEEVKVRVVLTRERTTCMGVR